MKHVICIALKATVASMTLAGSLAMAGGGAPVLAGGVGAAAGAVIGQSVGGANGAILGGALGGATGAAVGGHGTRGNGAVVGGAVGGAAGVLVGQAVGGPTGAILGAAAGGALGTSMGTPQGRYAGARGPEFHDHDARFRPVGYQRIEHRRDMWVPPGHRWEHGHRGGDHDRGRHNGHSHRD